MYKLSGITIFGLFKRDLNFRPRQQRDMHPFSLRQCGCVAVSHGFCLGGRFNTRPATGPLPPFTTLAYPILTLVISIFSPSITLARPSFHLDIPNFCSGRAHTTLSFSLPIEFSFYCISYLIPFHSLFASF